MLLLENMIHNEEIMGLNSKLNKEGGMEETPARQKIYVKKGRGGLSDNNNGEESKKRKRGSRSRVRDLESQHIPHAGNVDARRKKKGGDEMTLPDQGSEDAQEQDQESLENEETQDGDGFFSQLNFELPSEYMSGDEEGDEFDDEQTRERRRQEKEKKHNKQKSDKEEEKVEMQGGEKGDKKEKSDGGQPPSKKGEPAPEAEEPPDVPGDPNILPILEKNLTGDQKEAIKTLFGDFASYVQSHTKVASKARKAGAKSARKSSAKKMKEMASKFEQLKQTAIAMHGKLPKPAIPQKKKKEIMTKPKKMGSVKKVLFPPNKAKAGSASDSGSSSDSSDSDDGSMVSPPMASVLAVSSGGRHKSRSRMEDVATSWLKNYPIFNGSPDDLTLWVNGFRQKVPSGEPDKNGIQAMALRMSPDYSEILTDVIRGMEKQNLKVEWGPTIELFLNRVCGRQSQISKEARIREITQHSGETFRAFALRARKEIERINGLPPREAEWRSTMLQGAQKLIKVEIERVLSENPNKGVWQLIDQMGFYERQNADRLNLPASEPSAADQAAVATPKTEGREKKATLLMVDTKCEWCGQYGHIEASCKRESCCEICYGNHPTRGHNRAEDGKAAERAEVEIMAVHQDRRPNIDKAKKYRHGDKKEDNDQDNNDQSQDKKEDNKKGERGSQSGSSKDGCFRCGQQGHIARRCKLCRWCGRDNHASDDCRYKELANGKEFRVGDKPLRGLWSNRQGNPRAPYKGGGRGKPNNYKAKVNVLARDELVDRLNQNWANIDARSKEKLRELEEKNSQNAASLEKVIKEMGEGVERKIEQQKRDYSDRLNQQRQETMMALEHQSRAAVQPMVFLGTPEGYAPVSPGGGSPPLPGGGMLPTPAAGLSPSKALVGWDEIARQSRLAKEMAERTTPSVYTAQWNAFRKM